jgi:hypothetical protein
MCIQGFPHPLYARTPRGCWQIGGLVEPDPQPQGSFSDLLTKPTVQTAAVRGERRWAALLPRSGLWAAILSVSP